MVADISAPSQTRPAEKRPLLHLSHLALRFRGQPVDVVQGISLKVHEGEVLCIVGESGCGKSVTAMALLGLLPPDSTRISSGELRLEDVTVDLSSQSVPGTLRGDRMAMIFQEPMTSLNPVFRIGDQIAEIVTRHRSVSKAAAMLRAQEMLERVGIANPAQRLNEYPHQMSGGMRQRVMIAMALANDPKLLIADEPTTALDVTIQAQILDLIRDLRDSTGMGTIMITHDLGVVSEIADTVAVMYGGQIVEQGPVREVFDNPQHPYTLGLMSAMPSLADAKGRLATIPGTVPTLANMPDGCRFRSRCAFATDTCAQRPPLTELSAGHDVACHYVPLETHVAVSA